MTALDPGWLLEEFCAFERTLALRTAIEMDLFTQIGAGANTISKLAAASKASERGLRVLCDLLTVQGHLSKKGWRYQLTLNSRFYLTRASPAYLGSAVKFLASDAVIGAFCGLRRAVKRGAGPRMCLDWVEYARSMAPVAERFADMAAAALKIESARPMQVLDLGAGHGLYGLAIAARNRLAHVFALDLPQVLRIAVRNASRAGLRDRYHALPGDALKADFRGPYDLVIAANLTHHFDAATNLRLFQKSRRALKRGGRLAVIDCVWATDRVSPSRNAALALNLFASNPRGAIYTFQDYASLLRSAGFRSVRRTKHSDFDRWMVTALR